MYLILFICNDAVYNMELPLCAVRAYRRVISIVRVTVGAMAHRTYTSDGSVTRHQNLFIFMTLAWSTLTLSTSGVLSDESGVYSL